MCEVLKTCEFTEKKFFIRGMFNETKILSDQAVFEYVPLFDEIITKKYEVQRIQQNGGW
jgi:hypothetical protein